MDKTQETKAYYTKVYKSTKNRRSFLVPPEIHLLLKLEATKQKKSMRMLLEEIIRKYLKI